MASKSARQEGRCEEMLGAWLVLVISEERSCYLYLFIIYWKIEVTRELKNSKQGNARFRESISLQLYIVSL